MPRVGAPSEVPLLGAEGYAALWNPRRLLAPSAPGCTWRGSSTCCGRYGSLIDEVLDAGRGRPVAGRAAARAPTDYLRAEVVYAASHEGARHLDDVLARRTRISIETFDRGVGALRGGRAADGAGAGLERRAGRPRGRALPQRVEAERETQQQPDDETADAARLGAPEVVPLA